MFYRQCPAPAPDSQPSQPRTKTRGSVSQPDFAVLLRFCSSTQTRSTFPTTLKDNGYVNLPGKILLTRHRFSKALLRLSTDTHPSLASFPTSAANVHSGYDAPSISTPYPYP